MSIKSTKQEAIQLIGRVEGRDVRAFMFARICCSFAYPTASLALTCWPASESTRRKTISELEYDTRLHVCAFTSKGLSANLGPISG